ncbi:universal stress protein [Amycolatopsis cihanbeyliensis]|nr:universal stress protein [Amycolatopsis cihanbeyliensis]
MNSALLMAVLVAVWVVIGLVTGLWMIRRGRGRSVGLLGSVSADVVRHSSVPVLVVEPAPAMSSTAVA